MFITRLLCLQNKKPAFIKRTISLLELKVVLSLLEKTKMFRVESTGKHQLTMDEVEKIQRKQVATIIGHIFQLTYAAFCEDLVNQEKVNQCNGCAIDHPSQ